MAVQHKAPSLAERYRAHREAFELARELGCTPKEAEAELARRRARENWQRSHDRLEALRNAPIHRADPEPPPQPWWLRD
jgi:phage terminase small subunit